MFKLFLYMYFQEKRIEDTEKIIELNNLSNERNILNEQIFFLDLQHKTLISQYKKILVKIGSTVEKPIKKKKKELSLPFFEDPPMSQYKKMIDDLMNEIDNLKQQINKDNNKFLKINLTFDLFEKIELLKTKEINNDFDKIKNIDEIIKEKYELYLKKRRLIKECEYNWRNLKFLNDVEKEMSNHLHYFIDISKNFIKEGKWRPLEKEIKFPPKKIIFHYSFSIP